MAAGDFNASVLPVILEYYDEAALGTQYTPNAKILRMVAAEQTLANLINFGPLEDKSKKRQLRVWWEKICNTDVPADCDDSCDVPVGAEAETVVEKYNLTQCKELGFRVAVTKLEDNMVDYATLVGKNMRLIEKKLIEQAAQYVVAQLEGFKGVNAVTTPYSPVGGDTEIPAANVNESLFAYLSRVVTMNQFTNPVIYSGGFMYDQKFLADMNACNADGCGASKLFGSLTSSFDLFNIDQVNGGTEKMYMVDAGAVAFISQSEYPKLKSNSPISDVYQWSYPIPDFPGHSIDIKMQTKCVDGEYFHDYTMRFSYDLVARPDGCDADNTGIISFVKS